MSKLTFHSNSNHTVKEVFDEFIDYGIIKNLTDETIGWYRMQYSIFQQFLKNDELKVLLKKPNMKESTFNEYKMWVFINYLLGTGNRISTALNVRICEVDFKNVMVQMNHTKNRIAQFVPLSQTLSNILKEYLRYRKGNPEDYLF